MPFVSVLERMFSVPAVFIDGEERARPAGPAKPVRRRENSGVPLERSSRLPLHACGGSVDGSQRDRY